jgi:hypothetical protein
MAEWFRSASKPYSEAEVAEFNELMLLSIFIIEWWPYLASS